MGGWGGLLIGHPDVLQHTEANLHTGHRSRVQSKLCTKPLFIPPCLLWFYTKHTSAPGPHCTAAGNSSASVVTSPHLLMLTRYRRAAPMGTLRRERKAWLINTLAASGSCPSGADLHIGGETVSVFAVHRTVLGPRCTVRYALSTVKIKIYSMYRH